MSVLEIENEWGYYNLGICGYEIKVNSGRKTVTWIYVGRQREQIARMARIYSTSKGRAFFRASRRRIYLDECLKMDGGYLSAKDKKQYHEKRTTICQKKG